MLAWLKLWDGIVFGKAVVRETSKKKDEDPKKPAKKGWIEYKDPETLSTMDVSNTELLFMYNFMFYFVSDIGT